MADPKAGNVPGRAGGAPLRRTRSASGQAARPVLPEGSEARRIAIDALLRVDADGAYANVALTHILSRAKLSTADTGFVTELVYGTTRMRRSCDWLVDRFLLAPVEPAVRAALRCGAYQIVFLRTPPHAAVSTTVEAVRGPARKLVNAVLRRVAEAGEPDRWPDEATRLSYPDWIIAELTGHLGADAAAAALTKMNEAATVSERDDGYRQDLGSQWVTALVEAERGHRVADLCAAPGGKSSALAATGATVVALDIRASRVRLLSSNRRKLAGHPWSIVQADARQPPLRSRAFDRVLLDAPCSGLGSLRRRPDARWRIDADAPRRLAALQRELLIGAAELVAPGGMLVYSVCTMSAAETTGLTTVQDGGTEFLADFDVLDPPEEPWIAAGPGALLLPQAAGTDGMYILRARRRR